MSEVLTALKWRKAQKPVNNGQCVEVATQLGAEAVYIRDSKKPALGRLAISAAEFTDFTDTIKAGNFDNLGS
jgi:hypothetical protein